MARLHAVNGDLTPKQGQWGPSGSYLCVAVYNTGSVFLSVWCVPVYACGRKRAGTLGWTYLLLPPYFDQHTTR